MEPRLKFIMQIWKSRSIWNWKLKNQVLFKVWKPKNVLPNHFEMKSACFDFLTLLWVLFSMHLYGCCMFKALHVVWSFIFNHHIVHYNTNKDYVRIVVMSHNQQGFWTIAHWVWRTPNGLSTSFLHLGKMLLLLVLGFMYDLHKTIPRGVDSICQQIIAWIKCTMKPWNQPF